MSTDDNSSLSSLSSFRDSLSDLPSHRYGDGQYLATAAKSKFEKGLHCDRHRRYSLARSKFRAALKARLLLHQDTNNLSIAPVHEMIGMVERQLGEFEKGKLHLGAALEICKEALENLEEREEGEEGGKGLPLLRKTKDDGGEKGMEEVGLLIMGKKIKVIMQLLSQARGRTRRGHQTWRSWIRTF